MFARSRAVSGSAVERRSEIRSVSSLRISASGMRRALGGLQRLVVDREEDRAEQARRDEVVEQLREFLRVAVLDDPEEDRRAKVLLGLPALERGGEFVGVAVFDEEIDALGRELALRGFQQGEERYRGTRSDGSP